MMISLVSEGLATFTSAMRSRWELVFEHLALSHQVMVSRVFKPQCAEKSLEERSFIPKRLNWIKARGFPGGIIAEDDADGHGHRDGGDHGGQRRNRRPVQQGGDGK